jgi:hypothetical protein
LEAARAARRLVTARSGHLRQPGSALERAPELVLRQRRGLFLSPKTRAPSFNLQEALSGVSKDRSADDETVLDEDTHEIVKALASRLRTASTDDVATRVEPRLTGPFGSRIRWPWAAGGPPVRVLVDRRWDFDRDPPEPAFYVVVENTTDDELEVKDIKLVEEHAEERASCCSRRRRARSRCQSGTEGPGLGTSRP